MAEAFVDVALGGGQGTTASITIPSDAPVNSVVLVELHFADGTAAIPAGFTQIGSTVTFSSSSAALCYRVVTSGDPGRTITWTTSGTGIKWGTIAGVYSGVDTTSPIHAQSVVGESTSTAVHALPGLTIGVANCWVVRGISDKSSPSSTTMSTPTGGTLRQGWVTSAGATGGGSVSCFIWDSNGVVAAGTLAAANVTGSATTSNALMWSVALKPAAGASISAVGTVPLQTVKAVVDKLVSLGSGLWKLYYFDTSLVFDATADPHLSTIIAHEMPTANGYTVGGDTLSTVTDAYDGTAQRAVLTSLADTLDPGSGHTFTPGGAAIVLWLGSNAASIIFEYVDFGGPLAVTGPLQLTPDPALGWAIFRAAAV